jgi:phage tail tape-measure protein
MGHQKCGAVTAAAENGQAEGHLPSLLALIRPAVERARAQAGDLIDNAVRINVENVVRQVSGSTPVLADLVDRGALTVVGAVYSLDTGKVAWLAENHTRTVAWREAPRRPPQCAGGRRAEQVARQPAGGVVASRDLQRTTTDRGPAR